MPGQYIQLCMGDFSKLSKQNALVIGLLIILIFGECYEVLRKRFWGRA
jgi:hypothetical protein